MNFAVARKSGFKAVQARRYWNGRFGYLNQESTGGPDNVEGCGDETQTRWRGYTGAMDGTKFLTLAIAASWTQTLFHSDDWPSPPSTTVTAETLAVTQRIDANSGLLTFSDLALSPNTERNHALALYGPALWKWSDIIARMTVEISPTPGGGAKVCSGNSITISDSDGNVIESVTWDLGAATFDRRVYFYDHLNAQFIVTHESVGVTNTQINYSRTDTEYFNYDLHHTTFYPAGTTVLEVTGTLSDAHTSASVYADIKSLLGHWDLADDAQYPWRKDLKVSAAPLVSRDEFFTTELTGSWFARDYGNPISNASGSFGDPGWDGECGILLAPDPTTGAAIVVVDLPVEDGDALAFGAINPFSHCLPVAFSIIGGSLPLGIAFDAATGVISGTAAASGHYGITIQVTGAAPAATGAVLGAPLPAGYRNFFDFGYRDFLGCCFMPPENPGFQTWSWYQHGWGMDVGMFNANSGCQLPLNATQWTNYFQSVNKPQGAWLFYNDTGRNYFGANCVSSEGGSGAGDADALWACKYAECLEPWNSQNFARPAGDDKFAFDENQVVCAVNISGAGAGSTWAITDPLSSLPPADGADFSGLWGGPAVGGFFIVANYSGGTLTLGAKVYDVPSNWASQSGGDESFCFGKLRFPNCPALLGRIAITPDTAGTTFTFATPQTAFGLNAATHQEQIDLFDQDMTLLASNVTATRVDDSHFTILSGSAAVSADFVMIHGAAKWYVNDTGSKGDYALLEWLADFRSFGEYNRLAGVVDCSGAQIFQPTANTGGGPVANQFASFTQTPGCLPFVPCAPKVVCISPNDETFPNGVTFDFPAAFACDEQYGSKWWAYVQSTMTDLFWQPPHRPCNIKPCAKWLMDGGICADNTPGSCPGDEDYLPGESEPPEYFFAHAPQVEARLSVPCNYGPDQNECAPDLPPGIQIGWLSPVICSDGEIALPPLPPGALSDRGEPAGAATAWDLHAALCAHAAGCRFHYETPGC